MGVASAAPQWCILAQPPELCGGSLGWVSLELEELNNRSEIGTCSVVRPTTVLQWVASEVASSLISSPIRGNQSQWRFHSLQLPGVCVLAPAMGQGQTGLRLWLLGHIMGGKLMGFASRHLNYTGPAEALLIPQVRTQLFQCSHQPHEIYAALTSIALVRKLWPREAKQLVLEHTAGNPQPDT